MSEKTLTEEWVENHSDFSKDVRGAIKFCATGITEDQATKLWGLMMIHGKRLLEVRCSIIRF